MSKKHQSKGFIKKLILLPVERSASSCGLECEFLDVPELGGLANCMLFDKKLQKQTGVMGKYIGYTPCMTCSTRIWDKYENL